MKHTLFVLFFGISMFINAGPWFEKANFGGEARHRTTTFAIGNAGYFGLGHINSGIDVEYEDFWKYDPATDSWSQIANYPEGQCFHAVSFVIGNKAYVGTGRLPSGSFSKKFFCYDPQLNTWSNLPDLPGVARRGAVGFTLNGKGYVGTGQTMSGYSADFYEYNPTTGLWTVKANFPGPVRTSAVGFAIDNLGYLGTGNTSSGSTNDFYQYNPTLNQWFLKSPVGPTSRQEAVGFSVNGMGYIGTGDDYSSGNNYSDMWEYDPVNNLWVQIEDFAGTARRYLNAFVIGSRAYAGTGTNGTNFRDFWMFDQILSVLSRKLDKIQIKAYPIPVEETIKIELEGLPDYIDLSEISLAIFSMSGNSISHHNVDGMSIEINVSNLPNGVYFYQLKYNEDAFKNGKLIISH